jgi:hypothetical protein
MMQQRQFLEAIVYTDRAEAILGENWYLFCFCYSGFHLWCRNITYERCISRIDDRGWNPSAGEGGGYNWDILFLGDINTGIWPSRLKESQIWGSTIQPESLRDWDQRKAALARPSSNCKLITRHRVTEHTLRNVSPPTLRLRRICEPGTALAATNKFLVASYY